MRLEREPLTALCPGDKRAVPTLKGNRPEDKRFLRRQGSLGGPGGRSQFQQLVWSSELVAGQAEWHTGEMRGKIGRAHV